MRILASLMTAILFMMPLTAFPRVSAGAQDAPAADSADTLSLFAVNVGKADSLLLRSGSSVYLIDTGRGHNSDTVQQALSLFGITRLDGVIITHMDSDHVGGLKKLLKSDIQVSKVYVPPFFLPEKDDEDNPAVKAAKKQNAEIIQLSVGDELPLEGGTLRVLGPLRAAKDKEDNNSLVLLAETSAGSMLLCGDMEFPEESQLLSAGLIPRADVLKIANHGDNDATSEALLQAVQPRAAVISTSTEEKSSTPSTRVLRLLQNWKVDVYQTQETNLGVLLTLQNGDLSVQKY